MPTELAIAIVRAVGSALDYAHNKGLLHRDVKPSNILITNVEDGGEQRILLTDFGIARTVDDNSGLTDTNMTVGTVDYAAPEQLMGEKLDGRVDQYSLAATAFHLLTGTPPFRDSNAAVVIGRHLNSDPPAMADIRPELAPLDHVLAAALAKNPDDRFATCSDFARALGEQGSGGTRASAPAAPTTPAPIKRPQSSAPPQPPSPLAPGWYPDPSGKGGTLYWDGRGWHTAPLPKAVPSSLGPTADAGKTRQRMVLIGAGIAVAAAVVIAALVFAGSRDARGPAEPTASPTPSFSEPTFPTTRPPRSTTTATTESPTRHSHANDICATAPAFNISALLGRDDRRYLRRGRLLRCEAADGAVRRSAE